MRNLLLPAGAALALSLALPAGATDAVTRDAHAIQQQQALQRQAVDQRKQRASRAAALPGLLGEGFGGTNGPYANPYREYPASCIADPLPATPTGPVYTMNIDLAAWHPGLGDYVRETGLKVSVWRIPCSSSGEWDNAVTLMRVQRAAEVEGSADQLPLFPGVSVSQGEVEFDNPAGHDLARVAEEPNTIVSQFTVDSEMIYSTTYVLEAYPVANRPFIDYTGAFNLRLDNYINDGRARQYTLQIPAYDPAKYAAASQPLPINGHMSNNYYDPAHSGEGMVVQVFERGDIGTYDLNFNWFTYGPDGEPFWITGGASLEPGTREVTTSEVGYLTEGGFGGNFGARANAHPWGTVSFAWPSCGHLQLTFTSLTGLPANVPQGSGTLNWIPTGDINGLTCE